MQFKSDWLGNLSQPPPTREPVTRRRTKAVNEREEAREKAEREQGVRLLLWLFIVSTEVFEAAVSGEYSRCKTQDARVSHASTRAPTVRIHI